MGCFKTNLDVEPKDEANEKTEVQEQINDVNNAADDSDAPSSEAGDKERSQSQSQSEHGQPSGPNSVVGDKGGDTDSQHNQSQHSSHMNTDSIIDGSGVDADSSRGSTKATGDNYDSSSANWSVYRDRDALRRRREEDAEEDKEPDGSPILTKKYLREMLAREWRSYYRTAHLNEKLYLHYKGFSHLKNMEQFTDLKCLYFEGNGCKSMLGLEHNT